MPVPKIRHFVTFASPGTLFPESSTKPVDSYDVRVAVEMAKDIVERYGAKPYGFRFTTQKFNDETLEWDDATQPNNPFYFLKGKLVSRAEVKARNLPDEEILLSNMNINDIDYIVESKSGYSTSCPFRMGQDVLLESE